MRILDEFASPNFKLVLAGLIALIASQTIGIIQAQPVSDKTDRFDVAAIRPGNAVVARPIIEFPAGGGFRAENVTLKMLIQIAYDIRPEQITGGPSWTDSDLFIVLAKAPRGGSVSAESQQAATRQCIQTLLKERFHLAVKEEAGPANGYVLSVDKNGSKMTVADDSQTVRLRQVGRWQLKAEGVKMSVFASFLAVHLRTTVEDGTGLEGRFSFNLNWTPADLKEAFLLLPTNFPRTLSSQL
jgi:bla regulator protein blaR1